MHYPDIMEIMGGKERPQEAVLAEPPIFTLLFTAVSVPKALSDKDFTAPMQSNPAHVCSHCWSHS